MLGSGGQLGGQALYGNPGTGGVKMIVVSSGQLAGTTSKPVKISCLPHVGQKH
jgi:hypothetical protein